MPSLGMNLLFYLCGIHIIAQKFKFVNPFEKNIVKVKKAFLTEIFHTVATTL